MSSKATVSRPVFVLQRTDRVTRTVSHVLTQTTLAELVRDAPETYRVPGVTWELVRTVEDVATARTLFPWAANRVTRAATGRRGTRRRGPLRQTAAARAKIAAAKRGPNNPNWGGLGAAHRDKIRAATAEWKVSRRGAANPNFGNKYSIASRARISAANSRRRYRWVQDADGRRRQVPLDFTLPQGWRWGRGTNARS